MPPDAEDRWPAVGVTDDLGNAYEVANIGRDVLDLARRHGSFKFAPGVAAGASRLIIRSESGVVDVEVPG